jgi:hypothetical protein
VIYTGLVNGETSNVLSGTLSYGGTSQGAVDVGHYTIIPAGLSSGNYMITFVDGVLSVDQSPVVIPDSIINVVNETVNQNPGTAGTVSSTTPPSSVFTGDTNGLVNIPGTSGGGFTEMSTGSAGSIAGTGGDLSSSSLITQSGVTGDISLASLSYDNGLGDEDMTRLIVHLVSEPSVNMSGVIQVLVPQVMLRPGSVVSFVVPDEVKSALSVHGGTEIASLENGTSLPSWLTYDSGRKAFTAIDAPQSAFPVRARITLGDLSWVVVISIQDM